MDKNLTFAAISLSLVSILLSAGACLLVSKGVNKAADTGELRTRVVYLERELENMDAAVQALMAENMDLRGMDQKLRERIEKLEPQGQEQTP